MKNILLYAITLLFTVFAYGQVNKHTLTKSSVTFQIKNLGINTKGKFMGVQTNIMFNQAKPDSSSIVVTIDAKTIDTDNEMRDNHLRKDDYFGVERYPYITIKSVSLKRNGGTKFTGVFDLTIKDKTRRVSIPFTYTETANTGMFAGTFKINRRDYGVGGSSMTMGDEVTIKVELQTTK